MQLKKVYSMLVTLLGITRPDTSVRLVQSWKVRVISVKLVALLKSGAAVRDLQPLKVLFMLVTLLGIAGAVVRDVQLEKV